MNSNISSKIKRILANYYVNYSIIFCILFAACFFWFVIYHKSFFRSYDGLDQHYLIFLYIGKWFREVLLNIFVYHTFSIPMWDMSMGYGSDILPTLGLYFPDPFNWISVLFPSEYAEYGFNFSLFLKFYFTGIAFSYFGFHKGYEKNTVLFGSVLYTFCATMYIAFIEAPFINPMYIFPFLIVGIDNIFARKSPKIYILALGFSFINYFYFAYMMCVFVVGYCFLYYFTEYEEKKSLRGFISWILKFVIYSAIAVGLSMVVLLPILGCLIGQDRLSADYFLPAFYDQWFYKSLLLGLLSHYSMSWRDAIVGFGAITIFAVGYLFSQKKRFLNEKIQFVSLTIILCVPVLGSVMNGFSYYANRWVWAYCLCVVNISCLTLPEYKNIKRDLLCKLLFFVIAYFGITSLFIKDYSSLFITTLLLVAAISVFFYHAYDFNEKTFQRGLVVFSMVCVVVQSYYWFSIDYKNSTVKEVETGTALETLLNGNGIPALSDIHKTEGSRFDEYGVVLQTNANWISKVYGTDLYISIYNNDIVNFHNSLALNTSTAPQRIFGLNRRSELEYLSGTKYFLIPEGRTSLLPIGFSQLDRTQNVRGMNVSRYSNPNALPMIFGYKNTVSQHLYNSLTPYERQQLLMRACVMETSENNNSPELPKDELQYSVELPGNIIINADGTYTVRENNAEMVIRIPDSKDSELYVYFENISLVQDKNNMAGGFSIFVRAQLNGNDLPDIFDGFFSSTNRSHMYAGKNDWMLNLGHSPEDVNMIIVRFSQAGTYKFDSLHVYAEPAEEIQNSLSKLEKITDEVSIGTNKISAKIHADSSNVIYIAVPYSKGWKATLNGKSVPIVKANNAFMAINIEPGDYDLALTFFTPYLKTGLIVSIYSFALFIAIQRKFRRKMQLQKL